MDGWFIDERNEGSEEVKNGVAVGLADV